MKPLTAEQRQEQLKRAAQLKQEALRAWYDLGEQLHASIRNFNAARIARQKGKQ